jgi:hypothetical protein
MGDLIIKNAAALTPDYIPPRLIDREEQMNMLNMMFGDYLKVAWFILRQGVAYRGYWHWEDDHEH